MSCPNNEATKLNTKKEESCKENCSFEHDILTKLSKDAQLMSYDHKDFWMPMDTNREYELLNKLWKKNPKTFL